MFKARGRDNFMGENEKEKISKRNQDNGCARVSRGERETQEQEAGIRTKKEMNTVYGRRGGWGVDKY